MNRSYCIASAALLLALPVVSSAAKDDYGCNDVNFSQEILKQLPRVRDACQDVKIKNDKVYAHFVGEVVAVDSTAVTVKFKDRAGKDVSELTLAPTQNVSVTSDGKDVPFAKLEKGMKIDAYVEHSRWGLYASPDGKMFTLLERKELAKAP
jgi:hypothetical protein